MITAALAAAVLALAVWVGRVSARDRLTFGAIVAEHRAHTDALVHTAELANRIDAIERATATMCRDIDRRLLLVQAALMSTAIRAALDRRDAWHRRYSVAATVTGRTSRTPALTRHGQRAAVSPARTIGNASPVRSEHQ